MMNFKQLQNYLEKNRAISEWEDRERWEEFLDANDEDVLGGEC